MKTVRTTAGLRKVDAADKEIRLFQIRELLTEQRKFLINKLLGDVATYIQYKFNIKPDRKQLEEITARLHTLRDYAIELDRYESVIEKIEQQDSIHLDAQPFYDDINENISDCLKEITLSFLK